MTDFDDTDRELAQVKRVALERTEFPFTPDQFLWEVIKDRTEALAFSRYTHFIDRVLADVSNANAPAFRLPATPQVRHAQAELHENISEEERREEEGLLAERMEEAEARDEEEKPLRGAAARSAAAKRRRERDAVAARQQFDATVQPPVPVPRPLPLEVTGLRHDIDQRGIFNSDAYQLVKIATEFFVMAEAGRLEDLLFVNPPTTVLSKTFIQRYRSQYLRELVGETSQFNILPYLEIIRNRLAELPVKHGVALGVAPDAYGILRSRLASPVMCELIWNYWIEQGMMVQTINLVSLRFQNVRRGRGVDPLANFELDPLRPLSNLLWGYIQDELNRLTVARRAYEYAHGLGLQLVGKAIPELHPADVRSMFLPAFHDVLRLAWIFNREDDDKTFVADGFPLLNALRELHFVVAEGAHNQFGDLPMRARAEMLVQQWLLGRPEMRDFLRGRTMVPYPENWMDRVDAMKALQGWHDASVINYNDLAVFGEKILLSVRYGNWSTTTDPTQAANWARTFRPEIQRYSHALKVVSGIDLSQGDVTEVRTESERLQHGIVAKRVAQPGGTFVQIPSPVPAAALGRPGADKLLRPAPAGSARVSTTAPNASRRTTR